MKIGTSLRKLRDSKALTSRKVAERASVSHSTYMDWEHDKSSPSLKCYVKLAAAFETCPIEMMAYLTGDISKPTSLAEKNSISDMKEMLSHYRNYCDALKADIKRLETELASSREQIVQKQSTVPPKKESNGVIH